MASKKVIQNNFSSEGKDPSKIQGCAGIIVLILVFWVGCKLCGSDENTAGEVEKVIPGLEAADVYVNYEKRGFELKRTADGTSATWKCELLENGTLYEVNIWGKSSEELKTIKASVTFKNPNPQVRDFISFSSTFAYEGSNPNEAANWARRKFQNGGDTTIGRVRMVITATNPNFRMIALYGQ